MKQNNSRQIKVEIAEESQYQVRQYPSSQQVKIELDYEDFPPVRWFPIMLKPSSLEGQQFRMINPENRIDVLVSTMRNVLLDILSPQEADLFIDNYDEYRNRRIYVLIAIAFAKWRSFKGLAYFESMLTSELQARGIPLLSFLPHDPLARTIKACKYYIDDFLDKAVQELYAGLQEAVVTKALRFIKELDEQVRLNKTPKPDFDSADIYWESPEQLHAQQQQGLQRAEAGYEQNKLRRIIDNGAARHQDAYFQQEQIIARQINSQPFLISVRDDPNQQLIFTSDPSPKLNGKFSDWLGK